MTWFSRTVSTDSRQQLCKDFGEYPPKPLNTNETVFPFKIVYLNKFSASIYNIKKNYNTYFLSNKYIKDKHTIDIREKIKNTLKADFSELKRSYEELSAFKRFFTLIISTALLPLIIVYIIIKINLLIYKLISNSISMKGHKHSVGFYSPGAGLEDEINIKTKKLKKLKFNCDATISHEHLHLLQNKYGKEFKLSEKEDSFIIRVGAILNNTDNSFLNYLLEEHELEARLHELILSFYRQNGFLPVSYNEFIGALLAWNNQYKTEYNLIFRRFENHENLYPNYNEFTIRDENISKEITYVLISLTIKDNVMIRFLQEILPVMYSNLLLYYGDALTSKNMLESIPGTTLFYQVYGRNDDSTEVSAGA